jgi:hypothetical protein
VSVDYGVFLGLDVGKSDHHAVGLAPDGKRLHDAALPNTEAKSRGLFDKPPATAACWWWSTSPPRSVPCRWPWPATADTRWRTCPAWRCVASPTWLRS